MATVIEGAHWTLTEAAAERLVETGILTKCTAEHRETLKIDLPVYHINIRAPAAVGTSTLHGYIMEAEQHVFGDNYDKLDLESIQKLLDLYANGTYSSIETIVRIQSVINNRVKE